MSQPRNRRQNEYTIRHGEDEAELGLKKIYDGLKELRDEL